jgi:hypothetical protein
MIAKNYIARRWDRVWAARVVVESRSIFQSWLFESAERCRAGALAQINDTGGKIKMEHINTTEFKPSDNDLRTKEFPCSNAKEIHLTMIDLWTSLENFVLVCNVKCFMYQ